MQVPPRLRRGWAARELPGAHSDVGGGVLKPGQKAKVEALQNPAPVSLDTLLGQGATDFAGIDL